MGNFLIVSLCDKAEEYKKIADQFQVGFEYNDFYLADVLDDDVQSKDILKRYGELGVPPYCTLHGAFFDIIVFSTDQKIRKLSRLRMRQSMEVAKQIGAKGVVFHTNINPYLQAEEYYDRAVTYTIAFAKKLLEEYPDIQVYFENMFDDSPTFLRDISMELYKYTNFGVCLDYAHACISGTELGVWVSELSSYIKHIHINDNDLHSDLHLAVGDGKIDWKEFSVYYQKYFKDCSVLIETTSIENQIKSIEYLKNLGIM